LLMELDEATRRLLRRAIADAGEALEVLAEKARLEALSTSDRFALRYAIVQIVEALAIAASRLGSLHGYPVEGYVDAMRLLVRLGVVDLATGECLARLARLRNLVVHRYWDVVDELIVEEARRNGLECIQVALYGLRRLAEQPREGQAAEATDQRGEELHPRRG